MDESYDPNFRYASNEPTPSDWEDGLGLGLGLNEGNNNSNGGGKEDQMTTTTTTTTTGNPIKKSGSSSGGGGSSSSGPFDSRTGYSRSPNPGDVSNSNNGQCECKSLEKSIGWIKQKGLL